MAGHKEDTAPCQHAAQETDSLANPEDAEQ